MIWDYVSVSVVGLILYPLLMLIITRNYFMYVPFLLGIIITDLYTKIIKKHFNSHKILQRPDNAFNSDIFCRNGDQSGKPGMPSGHVAMTTFFFTFIYFINKNARHELFIGFGVFYILLMGAARYNKNCHNISQVTVGAFIGMVNAMILYKLLTVLGNH